MFPVFEFSGAKSDPAFDWEGTFFLMWPLPKVSCLLPPSLPLLLVVVIA